MKFTLYTADCAGDRKNCHYPHRREILSAEDLAAAAAKDHVAASYAGGYRSVQNFLASDVIVMDADNDASDDPSAWISPEHLEQEFSNLGYAVVPSRNNQKEKAGKSARPRFHVYFPISPCNDAVACVSPGRKSCPYKPLPPQSAAEGGKK